ncbi:uncharacterized protein BP01DRAFT_397696 [Aspergillus saccharolyticus JOP 1030-1]|uniref:Transcription factor hoxa13 n=1 Tax=Aspergillus saccharolyticus JOP 1030-1 TaxID=1450539 RepID=A0A318ZHK6_9EURO|nr:transcription factor hoxa13 [Aspergillus saccharolyticus JOP 1030-1]PYH45864.1 transcription factor hoxa13 [Aspergillus saccharolyticus JOP 1030-1]
MATAKNGFVVVGVSRPATTLDSRPRQRRRNTVRWTIGLVVRLCIWYALLTPFLRCPSQLSDLDGTSPRVCKPYLIARSHVEPHITPYYNAYGAPYIEMARPYVHIVDEKVYTPTSRVVRRGYESYGVPALNKAQIYGQEQWEVQVVPHLNAVKDKVTTLYISEVYPYIQRAEEVVIPPYRKASGAVRSVCVDYLLPFGAKYQPFIGKTYTSGQQILTTTILPNAQSSWSNTIQFIRGTLWPKIASLYWENVEPQLVKIGERLASYREGKGPRNIVDEANATQYETVTTSSRTEVPPPQPTLSAEEQTAQKRERIESDLRLWQEKFSAAAENGLESLEEHLQGMVNDYLSGETLVYGEELVTGLGAVVENEILALKHHINTLAESLPYENLPKAEKAAQEELLRNVKEAAISIRGRAHALREWRNSFENELMWRVHAAVNSTLDVLNNVRDLGFQEVGIRWASMDGITYKDWARYHALKAEMEDWKEQFVTYGTQHAKLEEAISAAEEVLSRGMDIAENAAKELARLREVGKWKISAREASDNFDMRNDPPPSLPEPAFPEAETADENSRDKTSQTGTEDPEIAIGSLTGVEDENVQGSNSHGVSAEFVAEQLDDPATVAGTGSSFDASNQAAWDVAAAVLSAQQAKEGNLGSEEQEAIERLISGLLVGKDAEFAEDIMNQLRAIYKAPRSSSASFSASPSATPSTPVSVAVDTLSTTTATPVVEESSPSASMTAEEMVSEPIPAAAASDMQNSVHEQQEIFESSQNPEGVKAALESAESQYSSLTSRASDFETAAVETGVDDADDQTESMEDDIEAEL